ncbi:hypothetical protein L2E82_24959 [Cichorium intybus]|uniref:Uncharacterized protein n=1 Tax=Cichorium intybus TaxID=13427 RepID=A0ACB9E2B9_CICIN|nr:hypothetical protein L2E82_24959 [Cichorium intybus]
MMPMNARNRLVRMPKSILEDLQSKVKCEGKFGKTKLEDLRLPDEREVINFFRRSVSNSLVSLFITRNTKKPFCTGGADNAIVHENMESKCVNASIPSSVSSFSRSCLRKTLSSSRGKLTTDMKMSFDYRDLS